MRSPRTTLAVFRSGSRSDGWCCAHCHTTFAHDGRHRRTFARFLAHRVVRHHSLFVEPVPGRKCSVITTHSTAGTVTGTWTATVTKTGPNSVTWTWTEGRR